MKRGCLVKKYVMLVIVLTVLLGACTAPVATVSPTPMPSATVQPSATPTATLLPSITPEPTTPPEPFLVQDEELINEQGQPVELAVPLLPGIQLKEVRNLADGVFEAYDTEGRLMLVNDGTGWVLAPMGMKLQEGIWSLWDGADQTWTAEWNVADLKERIAQIGMLVDVTLVHPEKFKTGEMQCIAPELCFHMQVKPEMAHEAYLMLLDAFAHTTSPTLRKYWREIGFYGNTGEQLEKFLQTSLSPDGNPYWLPSTSPQGTEFEYVQKNNGGSGNGRYRTNELVNRMGGVRLDGVGAAIYTVADWQTNPWVHAWFSWVKRANGSVTEDLLISQGTYNEWGLLVYPPNNRLMFVVGHRGLWPDLDNDRFQLGGSESLFRGEMDAMLLGRYYAAYWLNYLDRIDKVNFNEATERNCPVSLLVGGCDEVVSADDVVEIFEPQP